MGKRTATKYPGVFYRLNQADKAKVFYIRYRRNGKLIEEKAGHQHNDDMTPARASHLRTRRMAGKELSNRGRREAMAEVKWTIDRLWQAYKAHLEAEGKTSLNSDIGRYNKYLSFLGSREPNQISKFDTDRLRVQLLRKLKPQTVKHILNLLRRITNYGHSQGLTLPLPFKIQMPRVDNLKTEDLSAAQLTSLLSAMDSSPHQWAADMMKLAMFTGMRRGELLKLKWNDIDFARDFIFISSPKGGKSASIPMNTGAHDLLGSMKKVRGDSPYLFPGRNGGPRVSVNKALRVICDKAGLPHTFRPLHGLRHYFATNLAASGKVDLYTIQRLLTHKSPAMTQRYAHLRDEALKSASETIVTMLTGTDDEYC